MLYPLHCIVKAVYITQYHESARGKATVCRTAYFKEYCGINIFKTLRTKTEIILSNKCFINTYLKWLPFY